MSPAFPLPMPSEIAKMKSWSARRRLPVAASVSEPLEPLASAMSASSLRGLREPLWVRAAQWRMVASVTKARWVFSLNLQIWREQAKRARQDLSELEIDDAEAPEIGAVGDVAWLGIEVADAEIALEDGE